MRACDAGVARERQFRLKHADEWRVLARFPFVRHVWLAAPHRDSSAAKVFQHALLHARPAEGSQVTSESYGAGYEVRIVPAAADFLSRVKQTLAAEQVFDNCSRVERSTGGSGPSKAPL